MSRNIRQSKILDLIASKEICSHEEMIVELKKLNFDVNQSTVSRDIKELGLVKVTLDNGSFKYAYIDFENERNRIAKKYLDMSKTSVLSVDSSENLIVVKTIIGSANAACMAIDKMNISGILGSVAGDDTLLIIAKNRDNVEHIINSLNQVLNG